MNQSTRTEHKFQVDADATVLNLQPLLHFKSIRSSFYRGNNACEEIERKRE